MSLKLDFILIIIFIICAIVSYILANKYRNKKMLIPTYIFLFLILAVLVYATLDIIIVGGI